MFDLHRHDEFSTFDGFGNAEEVARYAKEIGYKSICSTNHGNTNGLVQTYKAAHQYGLKPILGVEGYFLPVWKEKERGFHMILIAKDGVGYGNMNRAQFEGEKHRYYNPIWSFETLEKYHEGLICTTACVAGYLAQSILRDRMEMAEKFLKRLQGIFGDDLYVEIQPYAVTDKGMQERVNVESIRLAEKLGIKCILTSDSHRVRPEDLPSYLKLHEIAGHSDEWVVGTYKERYMPKPDEMAKRFIKMHSKDFSPGTAQRLAKEMYRNLDEIEDKCVDGYLDDLPLLLPKLHEGKSSFKELVRQVKNGLKDRGVYNEDYISRCKQELEVIKYHGFEDYFLIVADYVNWAKEKGVAVGPGRGSVCNCLVAYALKITETDSLYFGLDFRRFLRKDKKSFPDIDLDFMPSMRHDVIKYICDTYEGKAARIVSYGLYKVDNLMNDLAKVCGIGVWDIGEDGKEKFIPDKKELAAIKKLLTSCIDETSETVDVQKLYDDPQSRYFNQTYDNVLTHFTKMYKKVRFMGTHAAGVAVTDGDILDYSALRIDKNGDVYMSYDLIDIESINLVKFDILGLKTMESIADLRESTGVTIDYVEATKDARLYEEFREGKTDGIFQFEKPQARQILKDIECDCFEDVVAASAMNRPGPLSTGMPSLYAANKQDHEAAEQSLYWEYTSQTYGTVVYQEQVMRICIGLGDMTWQEADKVTKMMKSTTGHTAKAIEMIGKERDGYMKKFVKGCVKRGMDRDEAKDLFYNLLNYTFNQGHAVGYSLISIEEMFYKVYYPSHYWFAKLKYARDDAQYRQFCEKAVLDGQVIFLPHVNYSTEGARLRRVDGEDVIQQGLSEIKNVGQKAAAEIAQERERNGIFTSYDDFYDRCKSRVVTSRVIDVLKEQGALEFSKKTYIGRVTKYNAAMFAWASR